MFLALRSTKWIVHLPRLTMQSADVVTSMRLVLRSLCLAPSSPTPRPLSPNAQVDNLLQSSLRASLLAPAHCLVTFELASNWRASIHAATALLHFVSEHSCRGSWEGSIISSFPRLRVLLTSLSVSTICRSAYLTMLAV